jgi:hypothetical protein
MKKLVRAATGAPSLLLLLVLHIIAATAVLKMACSAVATAIATSALIDSRRSATFVGTGAGC